MKPVSDLIVAAFSHSQRVEAELYKRWIKCSAILGGGFANSAIGINIQWDGRLDVLLRSMEKESIGITSEQIDLPLQCKHMFSVYWISSVYEWLRALNQRRFLKGTLSEVFRQFELLRMGLQKHEIPKDDYLKEPISMVRMPLSNTQNDFYIYDTSDNLRGYIMPTGVSERGSAMWLVFDARNKSEFWLERRGLSDSLLEAVEALKQPSA